MQSIDDFFADIDRRWTRRRDSREDKKIRLHIIGSVALLMRPDYRRGTKDSDVVQTRRDRIARVGRALGSLYTPIIPGELRLLFELEAASATISRAR